MEIFEVTEYSEELLAAMNTLLPQLSSSAKPLNEALLSAIIANPAVRLLIAKEGQEYLGSLSLAVFPIPTGTRAWIEDVVVSEQARGKGVGKHLSNHAIKLAAQLGAKTVDLTSRPSRIAANALYKKVGFQARETNVYRYEIT